MKANTKILILIIVGFICWFIYYFKYVAISPPTMVMLKNAKYTVGEITSNYQHGDRAHEKGYKYKFNYENRSRVDSRQEGEFTLGRKYLVVYDSTNIRNGYLILDKFDITDSLVKYHIYPKYGMYKVSWSLPKMPFQYDKSDIEYEVRMNVRSD